MAHRQQTQSELPLTILLPLIFCWLSSSDAERKVLLKKCFLFATWSANVNVFLVTVGMLRMGGDNVWRERASVRDNNAYYVLCDKKTAEVKLMHRHCLKAACGIEKLEKYLVVYMVGQS